MNQISGLQNAMQDQMNDDSLFRQAQSYARAYVRSVWERNIFPTKDALEKLSVFEESLPEDSGSPALILEQLHEFGAPATVAQIGGRYFGFVNGGVVPTALAAKTMVDTWDQNTAMAVISPISAKLESVVQSWLRDIFNLPDRTVAGYVSGTSSATFCGLAAARYRLLSRLGWDINEQGMNAAPRLRVVSGKHAHSTVLKAIGLLGFGKNNIEWVEVDDQGRIIPESVPELDEKTIVLLQTGNVNSGSFDPLVEICRQAQAANAWVHIDGAFGLWAGAVERLQHLTEGMELANSWAVDGHKTLNTPYDCGIVLCEDEEALVSALHMTGSYLVLGEGERNGMFYTPEMSRRSRIIELWATMKYLGKQGIDEMVWGLHERAVQFGDELTAANFDILNHIVFNQVLVACESDELTQLTLHHLQELRECWCGGSSWQGRNVIRISVCSWATTPEDVSRSVQSFIQARDIAKQQLIK